MPISTVKNTKIRLTMLCLSGFELYSRWVPLTSFCSSLYANLLKSKYLLLLLLFLFTFQP